VFLYLRHRREKGAKQQIQGPDGVDPYKPHRPSMYGAPVTTFTPYVSLLYGLGLGDPSLHIPSHPEPLRSVDVPSSESTELNDIYNSAWRRSRSVFWHSGGVISVRSPQSCFLVYSSHRLLNWDERLTHTTSRSSLITTPGL